jgi:uncharacterized protein YkwD
VVDPLRVRVVVASLLLALALTGCGAASQAAAPAPDIDGCAGSQLRPTAANEPQVRAATLCLINRERTSRGLRALRHDGQLRKAAQSYSRHMVRHGFFDHVSPGGSTPRSRITRSTTYLRRAAAWSIGENLYWGTGERATAQQAVRGWMNSPGHRHNMLNPRFRDIGIGIAIGAPEDVGGTPGATYTTEFGTRAHR